MIIRELVCPNFGGGVMYRIVSSDVAWYFLFKWIYGPLFGCFAYINTKMCIVDFTFNVCI